MAEKTRSISCGDSESETGHDIVLSDNSSIMNSSQISNASTESTAQNRTSALSITHNISGTSCRFPKLEECAHFHYERVQLGSITVRLQFDEKLESQSNSSQITDNIFIQNSKSTAANNCWFIIRVSARRSEPFLIKRSLENVKMLDEMLHRCVYDRKISGLKNLKDIEKLAEKHPDREDDDIVVAINDNDDEDDDIENMVANYLDHFSAIASDSMTCGPVLTWLQLDNKGRRLPVADSDTMKCINTPAVGAAYGVRKYTAQACDEISIDVGDMISVIDMPSPAESIWWRGKKSHLQKSQYEVGFFPQSCVATIGEKIPRHLPLPAPLVGSLAVSPTKPVLRKHGKLIAFFRSFILSRPSRRRLKQSGIYKERVFSCDLSEHLLNSGQDIPMVLKCCAEFIEQYGIVDGIYRLSGITSNIQKLRRAFDEERIPDLTHPDIKQDIHAVSSLLKMYFRELPNPLCTYQLYDNFVEAIQSRAEGEAKVKIMKETVQKLPPPHYRTLKYLATHLHKISRHAPNTGMTDRNLAIVWAPNLLRSPALESGGVAALRGVGVQAVVTEYLITNSELIFDPNDEFVQLGYDSLPPDSLTDNESLQIEQRDHDQSLSIERPKSLNVGGTKLISLEEAQIRHNRSEYIDKGIAINTPHSGCTSYIEVGGGPSSLPDKYHTVLPVPRSWQKRKTHSWKSLFSRAPRQSNSNQDIKRINATTPTRKDIQIILTPTTEQKEKIISLSSPVNETPMTKSVDIYDGKSRTMDVCDRSNSVDSLRTAGHSRSVSHDSYFDLLQSPLRGITCPSREFSELGLNFDREEPEMRIFSESESLVSSPKIAKEASTRRILRARPEEFSSAANSVNPSPKKQPRLNFQSSSDIIASQQPQSHWPVNINDESLCKRYKLEDQLSDIQFIDCNTPEHTVNNPNYTTTLYTNAQVHNPPSQTDLSTAANHVADGGDNKPATIIEDQIFHDQQIEASSINEHNNGNRFSYPQYNCEKNDVNKKEGRFSYPGSGKNSDNKPKYTYQFGATKSIDNNKPIVKKYGHSEKEPSEIKNEIVPKAVGRFSYCDPNSAANMHVFLRSSSVEVVTKNEQENNVKICTPTPCSPIQSPRYSLLVGDTSSENSSSVTTTPMCDMELSATSSQIAGNNKEDSLECVNARISDAGDTKDYNNITEINLTSGDCCILSSMTGSTDDKSAVDISALKRKFSLDLEVPMQIPMDTEMPVISNKQIINIPSTPNTPNYTHTSGNTSQSITPSEFGYQHLNRQSNVVSLESSPKSEACPYENFEAAFNNDAVRPTIVNVSSSPVKMKPVVPIKSTISITYNLKSPVKKTVDDENKNKTIDQSDYEEIEVMANEKKSDVLLETSFDESMVYEQVKFFKSAVSEINQMFDSNTAVSSNSDDKKKSTDLKMDTESNNSASQIVPDLDMELIRGNGDDKAVYSDNEPDSELTSNSLKTMRTLDDDEAHCNDDVFMSDDQDNEILDSLEFNHNLSLYENIQMKKPPTLYENVAITTTVSPVALTEVSTPTKAPSIGPKPNVNRKIKLENSKPTNTKETVILTKVISTTETVKPANFIVKQLATKFEISPVDTLPPFDFSKPYSKKENNKNETNRNNSPCALKAKNNNKQLHKSSKTRSLDENAFVREFGAGTGGNQQKILSDKYTNKSSQQIQEIGNILSDNNPSRRKSFEFTRPKSLNPPKRLPDLSTTVTDKNEEICKSNSTSKFKLDLSNIVDDSGGIGKPEDDVVEAPIKYEVKITPTTENRISLVQHNVIDVVQQLQQQMCQNYSDDDRSSQSSLSSLKMLESCKLDRERIEKIKEERRHQLNEKFRSESFRGEKEYNRLKSKSKTELRDNDDIVNNVLETSSLRIRSKSRGDIRNFRDESNRNEEHIYASLAGLTTNRNRRISDENNQNDHPAGTVVTSATTNSSVGGKDKNFDVKLRSKFDKRNPSVADLIGGRERDPTSLDAVPILTKTSREHCSPQFSIKDVTAMFESRSQNQ